MQDTNCIYNKMNKEAILSVFLLLGVLVLRHSPMESLNQNLHSRQLATDYSAKFCGVSSTLSLTDKQ